MSKKAEADISELISDGAIVPMRTAVDVLGCLEALANVISDESERVLEREESDQHGARSILIRISRLAKASAYIASDAADFIDCAREDMEGGHLTTIIKATGNIGTA